jgi:hypothetical protein
MARTEFIFAPDGECEARTMLLETRILELNLISPLKLREDASVAVGPIVRTW